MLRMLGPHRSTASPLRGLNDDDWDKHFILMNDVDLSQYTDAEFNIIGRFYAWSDPQNKPFLGVFDCNDNNPCTDDSCVNYQCVNQNDDSNDCSDNLWCTVNDHCSAGQCIGDERDCSDEVSCTTDSCNEINETCEHDPNPCKQPCNLTKAYWDTSQAVVGDHVKLIVEGFSCEGKTLSFVIREDELLGYNDVENPPKEKNFMEKTETLWVAEYQDIFTKNLYYYFIRLFLKNYSNLLDIYKIKRFYLPSYKIYRNCYEY